MKRDILDYLGNKIGELELPDDTSEEIWTSKLSVFASAPVVVFPNITARQIRLQLLSIGVSLSQVDASLDSLEEPIKSFAKVEWEYANEFERSNPLTAQVASALGMNEEALNQFWLEAAAR